MITEDEESSLSQFSDRTEKKFDFMDFARLVCNPKSLLTENKLLDKNCPILAKLKESKKVEF